MAASPLRLSDYHPPVLSDAALGLDLTCSATLVGELHLCGFEYLCICVCICEVCMSPAHRVRCLKALQLDSPPKGPQMATSGHKIGKFRKIREIMVGFIESLLAYTACRTPT